MVDQRRLVSALLCGLLGLVCGLGLVALAGPRPALALAGDTGSNAMRLHVSDLRLGGLSLSGDRAGDGDVAVFAMSDLSAGRLVIERDVDLSAVVPGATDWTIRLAGPGLVGNQGRIETYRSCVRGVGLAGLPLLDGLLDPIINDAVDDGFDPNLITEFTNLLGSKDLVGVRVAGMWAESPRLRLARVRLDQLAVTVTPKRVDDSFEPSCVD